MKLDRQFIDKPWGRTVLPPGFDAPAGRQIGEVWFTNGQDLPLLAKYIFTSERLSIQVHPSDEMARAQGLAQGKTECWYILDAEPDALLGLGLREPATAEELRAAAIDGSIEALVDWRPVRRGDFFYVPAGTIHAVGAGISLLEFQQNSDVTYRLYDYGRPRELHLEQAIGAAQRQPYPDRFASQVDARGETALVDDEHFILVQSRGDPLRGRLRWVMPLEGEVRSGSDVAGPGECLLLQPSDAAVSVNATMLIGAQN